MQQFFENYSLKSYNTFGIDVRTRYFFSFTELYEIREFLQHKKDSIFILSGGSNVLFTKDFEGTIIHPLLKGIEITQQDDEFVWVKVAAGEIWDDFVQYAVNQGFQGIENLSGIPGFVGTSPVQNIGAYGVEAKDTISEVESLSLITNELETINNEKCCFDYRDSIFKHELKGTHLIVSVTFRLRKEPILQINYGNLENELKKLNKTIDIQDIRKVILSIRDKKIPAVDKLGSAGSFFKNPIISKTKVDFLKSQYPNLVVYGVSQTEAKIPAGWLIEQCGWKGKRIGDAGVYEHQALILLNYGNAKGQEIVDLSEQIKKSVLENFDIQLDTEVNIF